MGPNLSFLNWFAELDVTRAVMPIEYAINDNDQPSHNIDSKRRGSVPSNSRVIADTILCDIDRSSLGDRGKGNHRLHAFKIKYIV